MAIAPLSSALSSKEIPGKPAGPPMLPANKLSLSDAGEQFVWMVESQRNVSCGVHAPSKTSGVTLGPGYDMRDRTSGEIVGFFDPILGYYGARILGQAAGIKGLWVKPEPYVSPVSPRPQPVPDFDVTLGIAAPRYSTNAPSVTLMQRPAFSFTAALPVYHGSALMFCKVHDADFCLSREQQFVVLRKAAEQMYARYVQVALGPIPLKQCQFDALVSIGYNRPRTIIGMPEEVKKSIAAGESAAFASYVRSKTPKSADVSTGIGRRHEAELELFSTGNYVPVSYAKDLQYLNNWKCGTPGMHSHLPGGHAKHGKHHKHKKK